MFQYDEESAVWAYTFGKSVFDYACMHTVMKEIKRRVPPNKFQPRTILDFGSGVGTSIWLTTLSFILQILALKEVRCEQSCNTLC